MQVQNIRRKRVITQLGKPTRPGKFIIITSTPQKCSFVWSTVHHSDREENMFKMSYSVEHTRTHVITFD